jgi:hypothetical protein
VTANDLDGPLRWPLGGNRELKNAVREFKNRKGRRANRDERVQEHRAIVVVGSHCRCSRRVGRRLVGGPMCVNGPGVVMLGRVLVRMRMDERGTQRHGRDGQRKGDGD